MIVRAKETGLHQKLDEILDCVVINGGAGVREQPTQALLDAAAIQSEFGRIEGLVIAICGDIRHSRVASSNAALLHRLGAEIRFVGPQGLMPDKDQFSEIGRYDSLRDGLAGADIAMALRMQIERMDKTDAKAAQGYFKAYGLTHETMRFAKPEAKVMHPGPLNRGVEIDGALADDNERSLILRQVFYGVPTRMAVLDALLTRGE